MGVNAKKVAVLGSWHKVMFLNGDRIPGKGETVLGNDYFVTYGGKGANQACACGLLGGNCELIQNLGDDDDGRKSVELFKEYNVKTDYVNLMPGQLTGLALVMIDKNGENSIMDIAGAHGQYRPEDIDRAEGAFKDAFIAGFVLETNIDATIYAIKKAYDMGVPVFLDPAPVESFDPVIYPYLTWIKPNEHEASLLSGIEVVDFDSAVKAGHWFMDQGVKNVLITLGGGGSVLVTPTLTKAFKAPKVNVVDTTTAGDIFAGSFLYALSVEMPIEDAVKFATCAGSLAVTKPGAMESAASYDEVTLLFNEVKDSL